MKRFVNVIRNNPALSLTFATLFLLITPFRMVDSGRCLKTKLAPGGIVSLELAWSKVHAKNIRDEWRSGYCNGAVISFKPQANVAPSSTIINKAKQNILLDFFFLIAYPVFFVVCILLLDARSNYSSDVDPISQIMLALAAAAGFLDAVENVFMYQFLNGSTDLNFLFNLPAIIKFLCVLAVIIYIVVFFVRSIVTRR
jgi:hypothetical protein